LWATVPVNPLEVTTFPDSPSAGTDRVMITWPSGTIVNRYLQITMKGNDTVGGNNTNTGLAASSTWYYGNKAGDTFTGSANPAWNTGGVDESEVRSHVGVATITNIWDFDKNKLSGGSADQQVSRTNFGLMTRLTLAAPAAPEAAPAAAGDGDGSGSAIASALAISTADADALLAVPSRLVQRLDADGAGPAARQPSAIVDGGRMHQPSPRLSTCSGLVLVFFLCCGC
jgi:hypothetical protein